MSLVEDAIRKMRAVQGEAEPVTQFPGGRHGSDNRVADQRVFGTVVPTGTHKILHGEPFVPDRIVQIDLEALRADGLLPPKHQERQLSQQYRQIKRPLIANAVGRNAKPVPNGQLIMLASAVPGEGKTFTSLNLSFSLTLEKDIRILLVDADLPKPHISKLLGVDGERGILDALQDRSIDIDRLILPTNIPGLSILPAGARSEHATELLSSDRMREILAHFIQKDPKRIVLFDSPPLLLTSESQTLAQLVGQIVIVVRAGVTPQRTVLDAIEHIGEDKAVGLILNQSTLKSHASYYYGYGDPVQSTNRPSS